MAPGSFVWYTQLHSYISPPLFCSSIHNSVTLLNTHGLHTNLNPALTHSTKVCLQMRMASHGKVSCFKMTFLFFILFLNVHVSCLKLSFLQHNIYGLAENSNKLVYCIFKKVNIFACFYRYSNLIEVLINSHKFILNFVCSPQLHYSSCPIFTQE